MVLVEQQKIILLFGMPRSGTTWIGKLFDSHKDTYYLHEPDSVAPNFDIPLLVNDKSPSKELLAEEIKKWLKLKDEKVIAARPFFKKSYLSSFQFQIFLASAYISKISARFKLPVLNKPIRIQSQPPVTVWKSIESLGRMSVIQALTDAYTVHILRHPCGHIASTLRGEKQHKFDSSTPIYDDWDLFDKLIKQSGEIRFTLDDVKNMPAEVRLAFRWGLINDSALLNEGKESNIKSTVLIYEDLCREPESKIKEIFEKVGLLYNKETQDFLKESIGSEDESYYATKKTPLVAAYKWREELTPEQQNNVHEMVKHFKSGEFYLNDF